MNSFEEKCYKALLSMFPDPEWIVLPQVKNSTGTASHFDGERYIDFFIMNIYPSKDFLFISIEAKQNIQDFRSDIKDSAKQVSAKFYSDQFFYLLDEDMFEKYKSEIWMTIKYSHTGILILKENGTIKIAKGLRHKNTKSPLSFGFICSLVRNAIKVGQKNNA